MGNTLNPSFKFVEGGPHWLASSKWEKSLLFIFFKFYLFILREIQRENKWGRGRERERDGERQRIPSSLHAVSTEPDAGLEPTSCEIMT